MVKALRYKPEGRGFETDKVNSLTEHNFQDAFKKTTEALGTVHTRWERCIRAEEQWRPVHPKLVSDQVATPFPEIMDIHSPTSLTSTSTSVPCYKFLHLR
jgi:hypothetical protein